MTDKITNEQAIIIASFCQKLDGLGIKAEFSRLEVGPVVTSYYLNLHNSVPIQKIIKKSEDFALAAKAEKVLIERIGGEIAIVVPNAERKLVNFLDMLGWVVTGDKPRSQNIPIPLGVSPTGEKASLDLTEMPHILIAGETGSGKSVLEASVIATLAVARRPENLKMILVDTKQLDLPLFKDLPHVQSVVTNVDKFHEVFSELLKTTRERMLTLQGCGVRNITEFHNFTGDQSKMPYIVVIIDELADLIGQDSALRKVFKDKYENIPTVRMHLQQLVQISRAAGVHIIACTQRSSVKIIDGDIKANFPCRIALRLPTGPDSRTILGCEGAENLLGKGDMLVQMPSSDSIKRFHGAYVSMSDISSVVVDAAMIRQMFEMKIG